MPPYIMMLILDSLPSIRPMCTMVTHTSIRISIKKGVVAEEPEEEELGAIVRAPPLPKKKESKVLHLLKNVFCFQKDMQHTQYEEHVACKKDTKALKDVLRKQGLEIASGSESQITSFSKFRSTYYDFDVEAGDEGTSTSRAVGTPTMVGDDVDEAAMHDSGDDDDSADMAGYASGEERY